MSLYKNKDRELSQEEIDYAEKLSIRLMYDSLHWREYVMKRRNYADSKERKNLTNGALRVLLYELQNWCN